MVNQKVESTYNLFDNNPSLLIGNLQVIACAGAGKTEFVSRRIAYLIHRGIAKPENIVAFTFTERAAEELKFRIRHRIRQLVGHQPDVGDMYVGTIHSFCFKLLQEFVPKYRVYDVLDEGKRYSSLGPIDPQVYNGKEYVPALGYLDQVEKLLEKAKKKTITEAEFLILQSQDLAMLSRYEQAKNLTITLLKKWLVEYKFHDWHVHNTSPRKKGKPVTKKEKGERAEEIARILGDNKLWHSHGRMIGINALTNTLRLKIEDYSRETELRTLIRSYNDLIIEYIRRANFPFFLHSKNFF